MIDLLLTIVFNAGLFLAFRSFKNFKINTFQAVVVNYWTCALIGFFFIGSMEPIKNVVHRESWFWFPLCLGGMFVSVFYLMGITSREAGVAVATVANKMSMAIPMLLSSTILAIPSGNLNWVNISGFVLAIPAIILTSVSKSTNSGPRRWILWLLPLCVFVGGGLIDTAVNYANYYFLNVDNSSVFIFTCFFSAAFIGLVILVEQLFSKRIMFQARSIVGGVCLGSVNYFSLYFLFRTLDQFNSDALFVFPLVNMGTIMCGSCLSVLLFKERLSITNIIGLLAALAGIALIWGRIDN